MFAFSIAANASAASWNGIEPFKSTRADVVKILGQPIGESPDGVLRFAVMGGSAQVSFVNEKFVTAKKLKPQRIIFMAARFRYKGALRTVYPA